MKSVVTIGVTAAILAVMLLVSTFLPAAPVSTAAAPAPTEPEVLYIVRELDGYLAVFVPGSEQPVRLTDIDVRTLTDADQRSAQEGISLYSDEELAHLLEDLES